MAEVVASLKSGSFTAFIDYLSVCSVLRTMGIRAQMTNTPLSVNYSWMNHIRTRCVYVVRRDFVLDHACLKV